jgi:TPR repeat protein
MQALAPTAGIEMKLRLMEQSAQLGNVVAMVSLGDVARELGQFDDERSWIEQAAEAGDLQAMMRFGRMEYEAGNRDAGRLWFERAGQAGYSPAYGALLNIAVDNEDEAAFVHWAEIGASANDPECLTSYATRLINDSNFSVESELRAHRLLIQAALLGNVRAMEMAGVVCQSVGHTAQARYWLRNACQRGDEIAADFALREGIDLDLGGD